MLLVGTDHERRADFIGVLVATNNGSRLLVVPRDVDIGGTKINAVMRAKGVQGLRVQVEQLLGLPRIDYYLVMDYETQFVSFLTKAFPDGLDINLSHRLQYTDRAGNLSYDLPAGLRRRSPHEIALILRDRHGDGLGRGDEVRSERAKVVMRAMREEIGNDPIQVNRLTDLALATFTTNIPKSAVLGMATKILTGRRFSITRLPGQAVTRRQISGRRTSYVMLNQTDAHRQVKLALSGVAIPDEAMCFVLNGTMHPGLARKHACYIADAYGVSAPVG